jgi:exosome complex component RRP41
MPLDASSYSLALLRLDGRRWNELRRIRAQVSTQPAADGSSSFEIGNTRVICHVAGPHELRRTGAAGGQSNEARIEVEIRTAAFSGVDRKKPMRNDK